MNPDALAAAGRDLARARATRDSLPPEKAAELAYQPGGPTVTELAERIRGRRQATASPTGGEAVGEAV